MFKLNKTLGKVISYTSQKYVFFAILPFIYGLSLDFSVLLATAIFLIIIMISYLKNKKLNLKINNAIICSSILLIFAILTTIWGIDKNDSRIGILRFLSIVIFNILVMQFNKDIKDKILNVVPYSALSILAISCLLGIIPETRHVVFSSSKRLIGFFGYANTFALYMLLGIVIYNEKNNHKNSAIFNIIFLIGIILTGSRTTFILTIIYMLYSLFTKKTEYRKRTIIIYIVFLVVSIISFFILKNRDNFERIFSISIESGTLLERIIYWKDGLRLLKSNLFGLGYMGYFYKVFGVQTAIYTTKFVHNEYLQMALDLGIIPTIVFIGFLLKMLFSKENSKRNKIILIIIMLHMFMEFDLQFMSIFYILFLCFDDKIYKEHNFERSITFIVMIFIGIILYGYVALSSFLNHINKPELSINLIKDYTEPKINILSQIDDINKAYDMAEEIEKNNKYVQIVYDVKSLYYMEKYEIDEMVINKKRQIELNKYDETVYEEYVLMLSKMLDNCIKQQDNLNKEKCINYIIEVEDIVKNVNNKIDKLEYKIRKNPEINLSNEVSNYITEMKKIKLEGEK